MKIEIHETKSRFAIFLLRGWCLRKHGGGVVGYAPFLTGIASAVVLLGLTFVPSVPSFAHPTGVPAGVAATIKTTADFTTTATTITTATEGTISTTTHISTTASGTVGEERAGVLVFRTDDGNFRLTNRAEIYNVDYGIEAVRSGIGSLHVTNEGKIKGVDYDGIYARHWGSRSLIISNTANGEIVSLRRGIAAHHHGTGDIHLWLSSEKGGIVSESREGVFVEHSGTGSVDLTVRSQISGYNSGILVNHSGDGSVRLGISDRVEGHFSGVSVNHQGPSINPIFVSDLISIHPGGAVYATGDAISMRSIGFASVRVAGLVSSVKGKAIDIIGGNILLELNPGFSLSGAVIAAPHTQHRVERDWSQILLSSPDVLGDVLDLDKEEFRGFTVFSVVDSAWVVTGTASEDEAFFDASILGATLRFSDADFKMLGDAYGLGILGLSGRPGVLEISGSNRLRGSLWSEGRLVFVSEGKDDSLTITGNYGKIRNVRGGDLVFHVNPNRLDSNGWDDDKLVIEGNVNSILYPSHVSIITPETGYPLPTLPSSPVLIEVKGEAQAGDFEGDQIVGPYRYVLGHDVADGVHRWRFHKRGLSSTTVPLSLMAPMLSELSKTPVLVLGEGEGSGLGFRDGVRGYARGVWAEQQGSRISLEPGAITGSRSRMEDNRVSFGFNTSATGLVGGDVILGASMSQGFSTSDVSSPIGNGGIGVESHAATLTASWQSPDGFYTDGQTRYVRFSSDVSAERIALVRDNEGIGVSASVEAGYRFAVPLGKVDFEVTPQTQLIWSRVGFDDFVGPHSELVSLEDGELVTGRLGLSWDGEWREAGGSGYVYGGMNLRGAVDGRTAVNISGLTLASEQRDLSIDGHLGISYEWDEGYAVHGEVVALRHDDADEVRVNLGMSIDF